MLSTLKHAQLELLSKLVQFIENPTGKLLSTLSGNKGNENKFEQKSQIPFNE